MRLARTFLFIMLAMALLGCRQSASKEAEEKGVEKKAAAAGQAEKKAVEPKAEENKPAGEAAEKKEKVDEETPAEDKPVEKKPEEKKPEEKKPEEKKPEEKKAADSGYPRVLFETSMGNFTAELYPDKTPVTVKNFLQYVKDEFFDSLVFHRVVPNFVIQAGGYSADMGMRPTREPIINEAKMGIPNEKGTLCMARTNARNSATSQFYVNLKNNSMLNYRGENPGGWGYCAFGKVVDGLEVVEAIGKVKTGSAGPFPKDVPVVPVVIKRATIIE